ncbi:hypothetical protein OAV92_03105 [Crocinitomicaceae bacterium]|jgi:ABC-type nickel/cobalt efflux system permease component RcnA|nr:hypothetical protein [Crocinitomicaceae bacterium]
MIETYDPDIVNIYLNGAATEAMPMMKLMSQVIVILIVGIFLWRISAVFNRKRKERHEAIFRKSRFQQHWKRTKY